VNFPSRKNPTASVGSEPAISGTSGQHANPYTTEAARLGVKDNLTTVEIKNNLLLATNSKGNTAWRLAAYWCKQSILQTNGIVLKM
jgi:hypothetical protein